MARAQRHEMQCSLPVQGEHVCSGIRAQQVSHARNIIEQRGAPERRDAIIVQRIDIKALAHQPFEGKTHTGFPGGPVQQRAARVVPERL